MDKNLIMPEQISGEEIIVSFSEKVKIERATAITVPKGYTAILFVDERAVSRLSSVSNLVLFREKEYGRDFLGKTLQVAFVLADVSVAFPYGFGNINVNNERLKEAYRMGAHGKCRLDVVDVMQLIKSFPNTKYITVDKVKTKMLSQIKTVGVPLLASYFEKTSISVFEISSKIPDIRSKLIEELSKEDVLKDNGLKLDDLTVDGLYVNEEDLQIIRDRING